MYQTVNQYDFIRAFESIRPENFSRRALQELFQHLEELERDLGEEMELDPIAICCDWSELSEEDLLREDGQHADLDPIYRYVIDLDERGEFHASIYAVDPVTGEDGERVRSLTGEDFEEGAWFEGVDRYMAGDVIAEATTDANPVCLTVFDDVDTDDALEQVIEYLQDEGGEVLVVQHYEAPETYLVRAN